MKIFNEILEKHTKICLAREIYQINEDIELTVNQKGSKVVMWAFNHRSDRFVSLGTKRFKKLIDGFNEVASDLYAKNEYYYITIDTPSDEVEITDCGEGLDFLENEVKLLKLRVESLELENSDLKRDKERYKEDYLYYFNKYTELSNKNSLLHNARGAGRKSKFSDDEVSNIKELREEGCSIKEIATRFKCSVGLIHKLINEK